jgi:hypothetical protein
MLLRPLRRAPMMLGGVGFQAGLDKARLEQMEAQRSAAARSAPAPVEPVPDVVEQLKVLSTLVENGDLTPEEFRMAKGKVLGA